MNRLPYDIFDRQLFLGSGLVSEAACYRLHSMLDRALQTMGGIQQGGSDDEQIADDAEIRHAARCIYTALTGECPWADSPKQDKRPGRKKRRGAK